MTGRLLAFVGPSGVGKDSVMAGLAARAGIGLVRRVITRPSAAGGEDFDGVSEEDFARRVAAGDFALHWPAHGLQYGIPKSGLAPLAEGQDLIINLSRAVLPEAQAALPLVVFLLSAPREVLAARLAARGRESAEEIARRLDRADMGVPEGVHFHEIDNSGPLEASVDAAMAILYPASEAR